MIKSLLLFAHTLATTHPGSISLGVCLVYIDVVISVRWCNNPPQRHGSVKSGQKVIVGLCTTMHDA